MKKRVLAMLMIAVMGTMTACGSGDKTSDAKETAENEMQQEVDDEEELEEDTEDEKEENMIPESPDDVKIDYSAIYKGGETFNVVETATCGDNEESMVKLYENDTKKKLYHYSQKYDGTARVIGLNVERYADENTGEVWNANYDTGEITKSYPAPEIDISTYKTIQMIWEHLFDQFCLPWEYASETEDAYVFEVKKENIKEIDDLRHNAGSLLDWTKAWNTDRFTVTDFTASCTYSKKGLGLLEMKIEADYAEQEFFGSGEAHYSLSLTGSNYGSTSVEIPEDILNNAVEKE